MEVIKVGEYCRTKNGFIGKIENINDFRPPESKYAVDIQAEDLVFIGEDFIKKHSSNLIDLIEEGDYVNGKIVRATYLEGTTHYIKIGEEITGKRTYNEDIKSIVTKEQMKSIEYVVKE